MFYADNGCFLILLLIVDICGGLRVSLRNSTPVDAKLLLQQWSAHIEDTIHEHIASCLHVYMTTHRLLSRSSDPSPPTKGVATGSTERVGGAGFMLSGSNVAKDVDATGAVRGKSVLMPTIWKLDTENWNYRRKALRRCNHLEFVPEPSENFLKKASAECMYFIYYSWLWEIFLLLIRIYCKK